jgi:hypothetical protein
VSKGRHSDANPLERRARWLVRLALEYGLRLTAMQEEWAHWAANQISQT